MANPEHVEIVKEGREAIDQWRRANPDERLDLSGANLSESDLSFYNLSHANLSGADLFLSNLTGIRLSHANLSRADLNCSNLSNSVLYGANLSNADLEEANLFEASIYNADLSGADLSDANLLDSDLFNADLTGAKLDDVNLTRVNLRFAKGIFIVPMYDPFGQYVSLLQVIDDEVRFIIEGYNFSLEEARTYWELHQDPERGQLYIEALDWIESSPRAQTWIQKERERLKELDHRKKEKERLKNNLIWPNFVSGYVETDIIIGADNSTSD